MHYGYVIEVIVKYCDNTCTSKTELDTAGQKCVKQRCIYIYANIFVYELHAYGYRPALHNWERYYYQLIHSALWIYRGGEC